MENNPSMFASVTLLFVFMILSFSFNTQFLASPTCRLLVLIEMEWCSNDVTSGTHYWVLLTTAMNFEAGNGIPYVWCRQAQASNSDSNHLNILCSLCYPYKSTPCRIAPHVQYNAARLLICNYQEYPQTEKLQGLLIYPDLDLLPFSPAICSSPPPRHDLLAEEHD